ncbi:MFS transporter [Paraburkholderia flagellata]|uniref:MFS transporter n=1 Tax=Paraburkholderia flagellata TaxID=2883241 RepID=UPI001F17626C|nr:MFS transporter [Paraburkholderia flagellata]
MSNSPRLATQGATRGIFVASIGNALEWFDFATYGFFAATIAKVFFPIGNEFTSLMLTLASFGVPFFMRPVGAIVIGRLADRAGRKPAMTLTVALMLLGTLIIAATPSYQSIGLVAPILIFIARLIQGFSAGGEFGSATTFLAEQNPQRRGFFGSWQFASQGISQAMSASAIWLITARFSPADIQIWAWRIPFFFGLLIGPVGLWMRLSISETEEFVREVAAKREIHVAGKSSLLHGILTCSGLMIGMTASSYVMVLFLPTFAIKQLNMPSAVAFASATLIGLCTLVVTPLSGALSDRIGARRVIYLGMVPAALVIVPLFSLLVTYRSLGALIACQMTIAVLMAVSAGGLASLMADLFPTRNRTLGISVGYNLAVTIFGGLSPMIISAVVHVSKAEMAPCWYVLIAILVTIGTLTLSRRDLVSAGQQPFQPADV